MCFSLRIECLFLTQILSKLVELEEKGPMTSVLSILPWWPFQCYYFKSFSLFLLYLITCLYPTNWVFQKEHCSISWHFIEAKNGTVNRVISRSGVSTWCLVIGECVGCLKYLSTFQLFLSLAFPLPATQVSIFSLPCSSPCKNKQQIPSLSTC